MNAPPLRLGVGEINRRRRCLMAVLGLAPTTMAERGDRVTNNGYATLKSYFPIAVLYRRSWIGTTPSE